VLVWVSREWKPVSSSGFADEREAMGGDGADTRKGSGLDGGPLRGSGASGGDSGVSRKVGLGDIACVGRVRNRKWGSPMAVIRQRYWNYCCGSECEVSRGEKLAKRGCGG